MRPPALAALLAVACAQPPAPSRLQQKLERAADLEGVPRPILIAMAYVDSRLRMNAPSPDGGFGLLHLIDRDDAPPARSLARAAQLTGLSPEALRTDPFANARGGAALLRGEAASLFAQFRDLDERRLGDWWMAVMRLSGVDSARVADSYASQVFRVLRDGFAVQVDGEFVRLAPQAFDASGRAVWGAIEQDLSGEYCPNGACVAFVPASTSNYSAGRGGNAITTIVIHDMEGSYSGSIAWFQNPAAAASAHFDVRSSDGEITQQVHDGDTAWHAGNWTVNQHAVGIEHEGYAHNGSAWYTEAMYRSSAALVRWLTSTYNVPRDRSHIIGHYEVPDPNHAGWYGGAEHHHDPCDSWAGNPTWHNNVACYWDWAHYMDLVTGGDSTGMLTGFVGDACCGISAGTRKPLVGATVTLTGTAYSAKTDGSGTYAITVPPGRYTPRATMSGYDPGDHTSLGSGYPAMLTVTAGATTWGSIVLHATTTVVAPPVVKITQPADGAALASSPAAVRGTVSDATVTSAKVDGQSVAVSNGAFTASVMLVAGANTITASATNSGGTGTATVHVSYAPPQTGVQGLVNSADGPVANAAVSLSTGGAHTVTAADGSYAMEAAPGSYMISVDAQGYQPLSKSVTVPPGKVVIVDLTLQKPSPDTTPAAPHIRVDSPAEGSTIDTDSVMVIGVAEVPDLASLTINDEQVDFDGSGNFSAAAPLRLGPNDLIITATERSGATITRTVHVEFAPVALSRTGCGSAPAADLIAVLMLGLMAPRRRKR